VGQMYPLCNSTCMANGIISPDGMLKYPADWARSTHRIRSQEICIQT
jgi:hypothetical protein